MQRGCGAGIIARSRVNASALDPAQADAAAECKTQAIDLKYSHQPPPTRFRMPTIPATSTFEFLGRKYYATGRCVFSGPHSEFEGVADLIIRHRRRVVVDPDADLVRAAENVLEVEASEGLRDRLSTWHWHVSVVVHVHINKAVIDQRCSTLEDLLT